MQYPRRLPSSIGDFWKGDGFTLAPYKGVARDAMLIITPCSQPDITHALPAVTLWSSLVRPVTLRRRLRWEEDGRPALNHPIHLGQVARSRLGSVHRLAPVTPPARDADSELGRAC